MTHCICVTRQCQQWRTREVFNGKRIRDRNRDRNRSRKRNSWRCAWREAYWAHNLLYGSGIFWSSSVILLDALQYAKYSNRLHVSANTVLSNVVCLSWETKALCLWDEIMKGAGLLYRFCGWTELLHTGLWNAEVRCSASQTLYSQKDKQMINLLSNNEVLSSVKNLRNISLTCS